mmetsp:Transcript_123804/g.240988  ORF Transcript_123804/g.240988 Transcript_123804/m.240988 type:complete len:633 (-) Transcript_123804:36-1934(-)
MLTETLFLQDSGIFARSFVGERNGHVTAPEHGLISHVQPGGVASAISGRHSDACRAAVAKVVSRDSECGTGFWVKVHSEVVLATSHCVLPDLATAKGAHVIFDDEPHLTSVHVHLRPDLIFCTDATLGFTLVACDPQIIHNYDALQFAASEEPPRIGSTAEIWHHPRAGGKRRVAVVVLGIQDGCLLHSPVGVDEGSWGAPILQEAGGKLHVIALHVHGRAESGADRALLTSSIMAKINQRSKTRVGTSKAMPAEALKQAMALLRLQDVYGHDDKIRSAREVIDAMSDHLDSAHMQVDCCIALAELAAASSHHRIDLVRSGATAAISDAMDAHRSDSNVQEAACRALRNMALASNAREDSRAAIVRAGATQRVAAAMVAHRADVVVQATACGTLCHLSALRDNQGSIARAGGVELVVAAMMAHVMDPVVQEQGCWALANLCRSHRENQDAAGLASAVEAIVAGMAAHLGNSGSQAAGCNALRSLADSHNANQETILRAKGAESIVAAMQNHLPEEAVQEAGCWALRDLARSNKGSTTMILWADGVQAVLAAMAAHVASARVQESSCRALRNLSEASQHIHQFGGLDMIRIALSTHAGSVQVQDAGRGAIRRIEQHLHEQRVFAEHPIARPPI